MSNKSFSRKIFFKPPGIRRGQSILGFVFSFIVVLALAIGITRIWLWFTSNFAQRQDEYQDTRMVAANKDSYGVLNNDTAYLGSPTIDPAAPLDITDDWVFAGRTDQEISFVLQPIGLADAEEECRNECIDANPDCFEEIDGVWIVTGCLCYDRCLCNKSIDPKMASFNGQIASLNDAINAMRHEANELREQAEECDDWWELCWWAGFGVTARKLKDSARKIDQEADKLVTRRNEIAARRDAIYACCNDAAYENRNEMDACLDEIAAAECPIIVAGIVDDWEQMVDEINRMINEANSIRGGIWNGLEGANGCDLYTELRCQKDCVVPNIDPCRDHCEDVYDLDRCLDRCDDWAEDQCTIDCDGLEGQAWQDCWDDCIPDRTDECVDNRCDNFTENRLRNNCSPNPGGYTGSDWWRCWDLRRCLTSNAANPNYYRHCMWTVNVPPCKADCIATGAGPGYLTECCQSFCCRENAQGFFYGCEFGVMHETESHGVYTPWWDSLPGPQNYYVHPWVDNIVECMGNTWGRDCYQPDDFCDEDCEGAEMPPQCEGGRQCGLEELRRRLWHVIHDEPDGLLYNRTELEAKIVAIGECCDVDWVDDDGDGYCDYTTADCFIGETHSGCQQRCISEIAEFGEGGGELQDECPHCFDPADAGWDEGCVVGGEIMPYCQAECISLCVGLVGECQDCCAHYATNHEPEKLECCNVLCQNDYPPCPGAIPDPDDPSWPDECPDPPE